MKFRRSKLPSALSLAASLAVAFSQAPTASAQAPAPGLDQQRFAQGQQLLQQQKYAEAIPVFQTIETEYPTSAYIPSAHLQIGICYFFTGEYDLGIETLRKNLAAKTVLPEVLEDTQALIPQLLSAKGQKLSMTDPGRKEALEAAVKEFDEFVKKFPQSVEVENANLQKARTLFSLQKFEEAAQALRANVQRFPNSDSALDTQLMLGVVLSTEGGEGMRRGTTAEEKQAANAAYDEAEKLLRELITTARTPARFNLAVMNDAQFQLGEVLTSRGNFIEQGDKQDAILAKALEAYRGTFSKELVVQAQNARIKGIEDRRRDAGTKGQVAELRGLQKQIQREQTRLAELEQRPDQTLGAKLKSGQIFMMLHRDGTRERMDEARVLFHFVDGFTQDEEQKKQILYSLTLTYAAQHLATKAEEQFAKWSGEFKDDPVGENLPLLMGAIYLDPDPALNNPQKAIEYFKKQREMYPKSKFSGQAVMQEGVALIQLKQYDQAAAVIQDFLKSSPEKELAAAAEFGLATIYKDTNKFDQAVQTFRAVRDKYAGTEQAEQAAFWVGQMLSGKGDAKGAITELKAFIAKFPKGEMVPTAILTLGQAQSSTDQKAAAIETFKELATKYPKAEVAPFAYFQQAGILQADQKYAEVKAVMKDFIAKYPDNERVYAAYDYVAQIQGVEKQPQEAIATYEEYAAKYASDAHAPTATLKVSDQWKKMADAMGRYLAIPEPQRAEWKTAYDNSVAAAEKVLEKYPESAEVAPALQNLLGAQKGFVLAKIKADANVETYFDELAKKFADKPATANKIKFTLAGYFSDKDKPKALEMMQKAYDPALVYAPADLDLYATTLIEQKKYDEVNAVADKLAKDFPLPPRGDAATLPRSITDPAALSLFLHAKVLQLTGKTAEAASKFEQLKKTYPWSPKLLEADFGIATELFNAQKFDDAIKLLGPVVRATTGPAGIRARGMMLMGQISEAKGDIDSAINNYIKIATFFEGVPELASEGLWRGAQLQEKKASGEVKQKLQAAPAPAEKTAATKKEG